MGKNAYGTDYEGQLHTETYKGYELEIEGDPTEWVVSVLIPEKNIWENILFISSEYCSMEDAIEGAHAEVDRFDT